MRTILDANGTVLACGETASLVPPDGGSAIDADATSVLHALTADQEAYWDGAAFGTRARALSPQETARRAARAAVVAAAQSAAGQSIAALTATQVRALLACLLYDAGAIDGQGVVQDVASWLRD